MGATVDRSLKLLQLLAVTDDGLAVSEVAQLLDISAASASRMLQTMRDAGAVVRDDKTGKLHISVGMWPVGAAALRRMPFRRIAAPAIASILPELGRPINLGVPDIDSAISVEHFDLFGRLVLSTPFGKPVPYHAGTLGKVILAFADESLRERILGGDLKRYTARTIIDREELAFELEEVRRYGFSKNRGEFVETGVAVGVALLNADGAPVGALSTPVTEDEMEPANPVVQSLLSLGRSISAQLGHRNALVFE
jgi:IclR family acetate operon transcriptional repressor